MIRSVSLAIVLVTISCVSLAVLQLMQVFGVRTRLSVRIGMNLFAAVSVIVLLALIIDRFVTIR